MTNSIHTCAICLEDLIIPCNNMCITECSHIFHLNCLLISRERNRKCPLCRTNIALVNQQSHNNRQILSNSFIEVSILQIILFILLLLLNQILEEKNDIYKASFL